MEKRVLDKKLLINLFEVIDVAKELNHQSIIEDTYLDLKIETVLDRKPQ